MITLRNITVLLRYYVRKMLHTMVPRMHPHRFDFMDILQKNFPEDMPFRFIQVGAHDGRQFDRLYDFVRRRSAQGMVIEPLPDLFAELKRNYAYNPRIIPVQKAIHKTKKEVVLYRVDPAKLHQVPEWSSGIASLDAAHHKKSGIPSEFIIEEKVPADTLMAVLQPYKAHAIDLLQIDTEGYDLEVLRMLNMKEVRPLIIKLEYTNLDDREIRNAISLLRRNHYYCFMENIDLIGIDPHKISL